MALLPALTRAQDSPSKAKSKDAEKKESADKHSGTRITETSKDFNHIHLVGVAKLHIRAAAKCGYGVKGAKELPPNVMVEHKGDTLMIVGGGGGFLNINDLPGVPKIELPKLPVGDPLEMIIDVKDLKGILITGTGKVEVDGIQSKNLSIGLTGTGSLQVAGTSERLELNITGQASYDGKGLVAQTMQIKHNGQNKAVVNVRKQLDVSILGAGVVEYQGTPAVRRSIIGQGRVVQLPDAKK